MNELPDDIDMALRTVHDRAKLLRAALAVQLPLLVGRAALVWWAHGVYVARHDLARWQFEDAEQTWQLASMAMSLSLVLTGVAFVRWTASLYEAAPSLQHSGLRYTARSAWAFFVPVAQWWTPYAMISELHRTLSPHSLAPSSAKGAAADLPDAPIASWWSLWIGSGVVALLGQCLADRSYRTPLPSSVYAELSAIAMLFAAAILARRVVGLVTERAVERAERLAAAPPPMSFVSASPATA